MDDPCTSILDYAICKESKQISEQKQKCNFFYGNNLEEILISSSKKNISTIFAYEVKDPTRYGIISCNKNGVPNKISEKPKKFVSNYAITGLYFFDKKVSEYAKKLKPSKRGELEIIDLIEQYKKKRKLSAELIGRGGAWLDTGSISDYYKTSAFVQAIENRQGFKIACIEEIAFLNKWINKKDIIKSIKFYGNCEYSSYLKKLIS